MLDQITAKALAQALNLTCHKYGYLDGYYLTDNQAKATIASWRPQELEITQCRGLNTTRTTTLNLADPQLINKAKAILTWTSPSPSAKTAQASTSPKHPDTLTAPASPPTKP